MLKIMSPNGDYSGDRSARARDPAPVPRWRYPEIL
jgi:hypothetical protein